MKYIIMLSILSVLSLAPVHACGVRMNGQEGVAKNTKWAKKKWQSREPKQKEVAQIANIDIANKRMTDDKGTVYKMHPRSVENASSWKAGDTVTVIKRGKWAKVINEASAQKLSVKIMTADSAS